MKSTGHYDSIFNPDSAESTSKYLAEQDFSDVHTKALKSNPVDNATIVAVVPEVKTTLLVLCCLDSFEKDKFRIDFFEKNKIALMSMKDIF